MHLQYQGKSLGRRRGRKQATLLDSPLDTGLLKLGGAQETSRLPAIFYFFIWAELHGCDLCGIAQVVHLSVCVY